MLLKDIIGQDAAVNIIRGYMDSGRLSGGYLFSGPEGVGKRLAATAIARELNNRQSGQHPDIHIIESEDAEIKIEDIRSLQREINFKPYEGKFKFFIIDNAHKLNPEASNALLKTLEEPSKDSVIILITAKPNLLFDTILSRCKKIKFSSLPRRLLSDVLAKEHSLDKDQARFLAYYCEGSLGAALKLKDTDIFSEKNTLIDKFILYPQDKPYNVGLLNREGLRRCFNILATGFGDIYLLKYVSGDDEIINLDRKSDLLKVKDKFSGARLDEIMHFLCDGLLYIEQNINIKLLLNNLGAQLWKV